MTAVQLLLMLLHILQSVPIQMTSIQVQLLQQLNILHCSSTKPPVILTGINGMSTTTVAHGNHILTIHPRKNEEAAVWQLCFSIFAHYFHLLKKWGLKPSYSFLHSHSVIVLPQNWQTYDRRSSS